MKPAEALAANRAAIRRVVAAHHACNPRVIGSVLRGEDTDGSDLDLLVDPTPETTLFDLAAVEAARAARPGTDAAGLEAIARDLDAFIRARSHT